MLKKCIAVVSVMLALVLSLIIIFEISDAQAMGGGTITAAQTKNTQDTSPQENTIQAIPLSNPASDPASETGVWKPAEEETTAPKENTSMLHLQPSLSLNPQPSLFLNQKQSRHKKQHRKTLTRQPPQMSPNLLKKQLRQQKHSKNWRRLLQLNPYSFQKKFLTQMKL